MVVETVSETNMGVLNASKYYFNINTVNTCRRFFSNQQLDAIKLLNPKVQTYLQEKVKICQPDRVHVCDGSETEYKSLVDSMIKQGQLVKLAKYENCYLARTDPADVARVESKTFIATEKRSETVPDVAEGVKGTLGNWMSVEQMDKELRSRFPGTMKGRTMYVIPFSMGPIGSNLSKIGVQLTDSPYVVASMRIMTRMGKGVLNLLNKNPDMEFVKCLHSVGQPLPMKKEPINNWPCNPERTIIAHIPQRNEICSFGSGYGGNSLLGKKCFALRIGSILGKRQGWLAEHMLILCITNPQGVKKYIAAAFPSACGKTNLAMMQPTIPGYKISCIGDDIAWMKFDQDGQLRAINPENGFFGVAPGTNFKTNPNAMHTIQANTIFTNVGETEDGGVYWEGLDDVDVDNTKIKTWLGELYDKNSGKPAAHPNSRFCAPASQCPIIDENWENDKGVPISAIIFGGRRPVGVPLVYESFNWEHGVFVGAAVRSEATAAAEHKGKQVMFDPFAMRPFFGYNFGHYLEHWLNFSKPHPLNNPNNNNKLPKIFHVNWFRKSEKDNKFLWPGFGENSRVLDWICRRIDGEQCFEESPIGYLPSKDALNLEGLKEDIKIDEIFKIDKQFWLNECDQIRKYFNEQVGRDLPVEVSNQLNQLKERVEKLN